MVGLKGWTARRQLRSRDMNEMGNWLRQTGTVPDFGCVTMTRFCGNGTVEGSDSSSYTTGNPYMHPLPPFYLPKPRGYLGGDLSTVTRMELFLVIDTDILRAKKGLRNGKNELNRPK